MTKSKSSGSIGEDIAVTFLLDHNYEILARNWRYKYWEIDIVALDKSTLVFVEVKSRSSLDFGNPEDFVDLKKQQNLINAADAYIDKNEYQGEVRFDIVSVYLASGKIDLIKDAFWGS